MSEHNKRDIIGLFYDNEGYLREDVNDAIREAVRTMPPVIDAPGWIGGVQIVKALLNCFGVGDTDKYWEKISAEKQEKS